MAHTSVGDLVDSPCRKLAKTGSVPLPVAFSTLHFPVGSVVVEVVLGALGQASSILLHWHSSRRHYRNMNSHNLLLFGRVLRHILFLVIPKLLLVVSGLGGFWDGQGCCCCRGADSMINEPLCQSLGTIEGSRV